MTKPRPTVDVNCVDWKEDCGRWRGRLLTGDYAHWCWDWDMLPVDETTMEFEACSCFDPGGMCEQPAPPTGT